MISCIIIEDQEPAQRILKKYIDDSKKLELKKCFNNALSAMDYLKNNQVDLMFLDIHLPKLSGIDFLNSLTHKPLVIITTAFTEYALKGYELNIVDYLLKPFSYSRFSQAIEKVQQRMQTLVESANKTTADTDTIVVKDGYDYVKIIPNNILYIHSDGDYTHVHCKVKKFFVAYPLRFWDKTLSEKHFLRIHKSFIVNISHIQKVSSTNVLINNIEIPIGRVYKKQLQQKYLKL